MKLLTKLLVTIVAIWIAVALSVQFYFAYLNLTGHPEKVRKYLPL